MPAYKKGIQHMDWLPVRGDDNLAKMVSQKPSIAMLSLDIPYIALERYCVSDRTFRQNDLKMSDC